MDNHARVCLVAWSSQRPKRLHFIAVDGFAINSDEMPEIIRNTYATKLSRLGDFGSTWAKNYLTRKQDA